MNNRNPAINQQSEHIQNEKAKEKKKKSQAKKQEKTQFFTCKPN